MTVQDDKREKELIQLFQLEKPANASRSGTDAILDINGQKIPFELKSTTKTSVTTVRDFGPVHIEKWRIKHWLFGFYNNTGTTLKYCLYGSPQLMAPWIQEKEEYVRLDFRLAQIVPQLVTMNVLHQLLGSKDRYSLEDVKFLMKKQYSITEYRDRMDILEVINNKNEPIAYSPEKMLEFLKDRCEYLLNRGSTLNNPHIPASYFHGWEPITTNHAQHLRALVTQTLQENT